jgi:hypothetical protein
MTGPVHCTYCSATSNDVEPKWPNEFRGIVTTHTCAPRNLLQLQPRAMKRALKKDDLHAAGFGLQK